jgi:eukaryotic-like serine/threonine-protein kinase
MPAIQRIGKFEIKEELGRGGMGVVYRAYDTALGRHVALKVIAPHRLEDEQAIARFQTEAHNLAQFKHPHIVTVYEGGAWEGEHYLAMELLEGRSLAQWLRDEPIWPPERVARLLVQVGEALDYAHARRVFHRDIKPANIMVTPDEQATLTDFGLVKSADDSTLTQLGAVVGTPWYMSPAGAALRQRG